MSYSKEQFIEDFKNAYNQSQQLHYLYRYLKEYEGQIASVNVKKLEEETDSVAYYQFSFTLDNGNVIETDSIAFASYTFVNELDNRVISINNTITSINNTITSLDRRISNNEGNIVDINDKMLTLPSTAPTTRKVVTIDTNGAQDNVDGTELTTLMSNIVDSHGNKRFAEGDITLGTPFANLGVTMTYGKWQLSGGHLMIVVALKIPSNVTTPINALIARVILPQWLSNKLVGLWSNTLDIKNFFVRNSVNWYQDITTLKNVVIYKDGNNMLNILSSDSLTTEVESTCRIQFDFIIDSE